jgi:hypothetical protein
MKYLQSAVGIMMPDLFDPSQSFAVWVTRTHMGDRRERHTLVGGRCGFLERSQVDIDAIDEGHGLYHYGTADFAYEWDDKEINDPVHLDGAMV